MIEVKGQSDKIAFHITDQFVEVIYEGNHDISITHKEIERLATILRKQCEVERLQNEIQREADGVADMPPFG